MLVAGCGSEDSTSGDSSGKEEELLLPGSVNGVAGLAEALSKLDSPATVSIAEETLPSSATDEKGTTQSVAGSYKSTMGVMDRFS